MNTRHDNADGPEDIDAAFAEIVAGLERDAPFSRWPDSESDEADSSDLADSDVTDPAPAATSANAPTGETPGESTGPRDWTPGEEDEGHYEPPEPPPLPTPRPATLGGVVLIALGVLLLVVPGLLGVASTVSLPLGLIGISAGIAWLLLRMRRDPPEHTDDGAQL